MARLDTDRAGIHNEDNKLLSQGEAPEGLQEPNPRPFGRFPGDRGWKAKNGRGYGELNDEEIHEEMRKASTAGDHARTREIMRTIVQDRGQKPSRKHYHALILANTNPRLGSVSEVVSILQEMEEVDIPLDFASYHAVLKVLAIHPDHLLRRQILDEFRTRWFSLSNEGWHDVIVGLLRDKQIELALQNLQSAQQEGVRIGPWLYDMLIYNLCDIGEHDEALSTLKSRVESGEQLISGTLWYYLLDSASSAFHYPATLYAWRRRVQPGYLNPPSGICLNVLNTAARHPDPDLATEVIRVLEERSQTLQLHHYEALLEAHLPSNLRAALTVLVIMPSKGLSPTPSSTRPLFLHLRQSPDLPSEALSILRDLHAQDNNSPVPLEAINVLIESHIVHHHNFPQAFHTYKALRSLCPSGPSLSTFTSLLRGCPRGRTDVAVSLAEEMAAAGIAPDAWTYELLILVCMDDEREGEGRRLDDAWWFFEQMRGKGWWLREGTAMALARKACWVADERVWSLQRGGEGGGGGGGGGGGVGIEREVLTRLVEEEWGKGKKEE
ncbi:MAG: hypothetical protein Q9219_003428 [cf. Caloplaca sp. 3 TL-2023]